MQEKIDNMLSKERWAVVGATRNKEKFGYKIYKLLKEKGYEVTPINPVYADIEGDPTREDLKALDSSVDCVSVVVSPKRSEVVLEQAIDLGIKNIWFQPGTFTPEIIDKAEDAGLNVVYYDCVLVELGKRD